MVCHSLIDARKINVQARHSRIFSGSALLNNEPRFWLRSTRILGFSCGPRLLPAMILSPGYCLHFCWRVLCSNHSPDPCWASPLPPLLVIYPLQDLTMLPGCSQPGSPLGSPTLLTSFILFWLFETGSPVIPADFKLAV